MDFLPALFIFALCFVGMAIGLILNKKELRKGCSDEPENCACKAEGKDPSQCDK